MVKYMNKTFFPAPYVGICFTEADYLEEMKRLNITYFDRWVTKGVGGTTHTFDNEDGEQTIIVCIELSEKYSLNAHVGLLVHEAVHAAEKVFEHINESAPGRETFAYTVQWITLNFLSAYDEYMGYE